VYVEYGDAASLLVRISPNYYTGGLALGEFIARACLSIFAWSALDPLGSVETMLPKT